MFYASLLSDVLPMMTELTTMTAAAPAATGAEAVATAANANTPSPAAAPMTITSPIPPNRYDRKGILVLVP